MLVLSRQREEVTMIGDIEITILGIRGDRVWLGISAPRAIPVHRKEVYEAVKRENRAAVSMRPEDLKGLKPKGDKR